MSRGLFFVAGLMAVSFTVQPVLAKKKFNVICQLNGQHAGEPDRIEAQREIQLLQTAIERAYPHLPPYLKQVADQVAFVVNHSEIGLTKRFMGWSAEDDPEYAPKYPDTSFWNPKTNPQGAIKTNYTEKFIQALDLSDRIARLDIKVAYGAGLFARVVITHELQHAYQYHKHPVKDLQRFGDVCPEGLCDEKILADAIQKVEYEHQAFGVQRKTMMRDPQLAYADAVEKYMQENPEQFAEKGRYHLLSSTHKNPYLNRYLREEANTIQDGEKFGPTADILYNSQVVLPTLVLQLKKLNDSYGAQKASGNANIYAYIAQLTDIRNQWGQLTSTDLWQSGAIKKSLTYLEAVEARFIKESQRAEELH